MAMEAPIPCSGGAARSGDANQTRRDHRGGAARVAARCGEEGREAPAASRSRGRELRVGGACRPRGDEFTRATRGPVPSRRWPDRPHDRPVGDLRTRPRPLVRPPGLFRGAKGCAHRGRKRSGWRYPAVYRTTWTRLTYRICIKVRCTMWLDISNRRCIAETTAQRNFRKRRTRRATRCGWIVADRCARLLVPLPRGSGDSSVRSACADVRTGDDSLSAVLSNFSVFARHKCQNIHTFLPYLKVCMAF